MRRLAAVLSALFVTLVLVAPPAQAHGGSGPVRYVALGDSYSAASGVLPPDLTAPPQCLRSTANYPHVIAAATGARLTDVTCGGADTGDYLAAQYPGVAPQLDAVSSDTQVITMTIGGNDSGVFIDSITQCGAAGLSTLGRGSPCRDRYGSSFEDTIRTTTYPSLVQALRAVRAKAPRAEVAILGYPSILPATGGCFPQMPVAEGDVPYLRGVQATLNDAIRRAAKATGVTYVDMTRVSEGHDACQPIGVRWVEPVVGGTNPVVVHPNALGEARMAAQAMKALRRL
ncbi:SGNH/GDSL hydrolase family protein [Blastococcus goldschmidtiae]|uniref:SGNH/GDSL hydrolase family protein n=1 Tax=Blastococcus goldschmidtiae TaxID=3075546 RepID=A0ABU2K5B5_9ACTN|nr:SGNH/GDSL hydrolase family protein [Blastococcus sp. DSM 46792]MDT0275392.1 SGNH/GDSL hydrolase family protein [Blastococcus sp. DSM 46792]